MGSGAGPIVVATTRENSEQKMSKIETLMMAQTYIKALAKLIETEDSKAKDYDINIKMENSM